MTVAHMDRRLLRALAGFGFSILAVIFIWGGHVVWQEGRHISAREFRFAAEYLLGSQLLWALSGATGAGIIALNSRTIERSVAALLAASVVPLLVIVPMYIWTNPDLPPWLHQITPTPEWLVNGYVQAAAPVLLGVLIGSALWRPSR
ncbi:MAG: hypothetical protein ACLFRT_14355 [Actinomycetota bacterium]